MTSAPALAQAPIVVEHLSKAYRIYAHPADRLKEIVLRRPYHRAFSALDDISFEVHRAETFGLIGENGAGKSTLLKLLAGTIRPSAGRLEMRGRMAALLELGAGFHPELSGRDNVFLQAAVLGLSRAETERRYPEIVEFSELPEDTLGRPVKTYSSGMFVRLAFAVATCVSPDILLVDEALSVGDMHFQKKSLDRIMAFRKAGKTIIFCSHNMYQIRTLCQRAVWLKDGRAMALGEAEEVVTAYEAYQRTKDPVDEPIRPGEADSVPSPRAEAQPSGPVRLTRIAITGEDHQEAPVLPSHRDAYVDIAVEVEEQGQPFHLAVVVQRNDGINVFFTTTAAQGLAPITAERTAQAKLHLPRFALLSGDYKLFVYALDDHAIQVYDMAEGICPFQMRAKPSEMGVVTLPHEWIVEAD